MLWVQYCGMKIKIWSKNQNCFSILNPLLREHLLKPTMISMKYCKWWRKSHNEKKWWESLVVYKPIPNLLHMFSWVEVLYESPIGPVDCVNVFLIYDDIKLATDLLQLVFFARCFIFSYLDKLFWVLFCNKYFSW